MMSFFLNKPQVEKMALAKMKGLKRRKVVSTSQDEKAQVSPKKPRTD